MNLNEIACSIIEINSKQTDETLQWNRRPVLRHNFIPKISVHGQQS